VTSRITGRDSHCSLPAAPPISSSQTTRGDGGSEGNPESCFIIYVPHYERLFRAALTAGSVNCGAKFR